MTVAMQIQQLFFRLHRRQARRRAIHDFRRSLALIVDPEALESSVAMRLKELFDPDRLIILQLEKVSERYRPTFCSGVERETLDDLVIEPQGRLARWFRVNETCLLIPRDRGVFEYLGRQEQELLRRQGIQLCAPLLARNHLAGMLLLGWTQPERKLGKNDADLLLHLANQTSLAFENAALYREQQERLERWHRADRLAAVGQLAASVAHEVGNPLTAIRSTMQYLEGSFPEEGPKQKLITGLISEVDRINETLGNLLSLTRSDEFHPEEIHLSELLRKTRQLVEIQARKAAIHIELPASSSSLVLWGDRNQLRQLFLNLILNAFQAMPEGGRIEIDAGQAEDPGRQARITIADQGVGIPQDQLQKIFDPFFTTKHEGTGLGLAICQNIVRRHDGKLELSSIEGQGTTAVLHLPLADGVRSSGPAPQGSPEE